MKVDMVLGSTRFDTAVEDTPVTQKTLSEAMSKLLSTDLPAAMKTQFEAQNTSIAALIEKVNKAATVVTPPAAVVVPPPVPGAPPALDPATNAKLLEYEQLIKKLGDTQKKEVELREAAEKRSEQLALQNGIESELSKYNFGKPEGKTNAAKLITPDVVKNEKGEFIANNLPLADYVKNFLTVENDYMLAPASTGGGTGAGRGPSRPPGSKTINIEDIRPGMTDVEYKAIAEQILSVLPSNSSMSA